MSTSTPTLNPNVPFFITVVTDLVIGAVIRNSNPTTEAARANTVIGVANGVLKLASGDPTDGLVAIDAAIATPTTDPAAAAAISTAVSWIATKAAAFQQLLAGSITAVLASQIASQVANAAIAVATKYLPATTTTSAS